MKEVANIYGLPHTAPILYGIILVSNIQWAGGTPWLLAPPSGGGPCPKRRRTDPIPQTLLPTSLRCPSSIASTGLVKYLPLRLSHIPPIFHHLSSPRPALSLARFQPHSSSTKASQHRLVHLMTPHLNKLTLSINATLDPSSPPLPSAPKTPRKPARTFVHIPNPNL